MLQFRINFKLAYEEYLVNFIRKIRNFAFKFSDIIFMKSFTVFTLICSKFDPSTL